MCVDPTLDVRVAGRDLWERVSIADSIVVGWLSAPREWRSGADEQTLSLEWIEELKAPTLFGSVTRLRALSSYGLSREQAAPVPAGYVGRIGRRRQRVVAFLTQHSGGSLGLWETEQGYAVEPYDPTLRSRIVQELVRQQGVQSDLPVATTPGLSGCEVHELVAAISGPVAEAQRAVDRLSSAGRAVVPALIRHMDDRRLLPGTMLAAMRADGPRGEAIGLDPIAGNTVMSAIDLMLQQLTGHAMCPDARISHPARTADYYWTRCAERWRLWWWTAGEQLVRGATPGRQP